MRHRIVLFGEAEKGSFHVPHTMKEMAELVERLGNPPEESQGIFFAIQALLYKREVLYFRVAEEGFSPEDYWAGVSWLQSQKKGSKISALCLPGVGDPSILNAMTPLCERYQSPLITSEKDLFDYLYHS